LAEHLDYLQAQGVQPGEITLLSPRPFTESAAAALPRHWLKRIRVIDAVVAGQLPLRQITFSTIEDFKGLENRFVAVTDLAGVNSTSRDLSLLYVAMSRARTALWISVTPELHQQLKEAGMRNLSLVAPKQ
jgi:ATP-dependent exoDNAse (exonuclease V) beta subunit